MPVCLREVIEEDSLSVIQAGCCERLGRALAILDRDPGAENFGHRIDSVNLQQFDPFCTLLRDEDQVLGGNEACERSIIEETRLSLQEFLETGDPFRSYTCHMGVVEATYVIQIRGHPVAMLHSGHYCPPEGTERIQEAVLALGTEGYPETYLNPSTRRELLRLTQEFTPAPNNWRDLLRREAAYIQGIAEAQYQQAKFHWEQEFLDTLRFSPEYYQTDGQTTLERLRGRIQLLLQRVQTFCRSQYAAFFASVQEGDTVLAPLAVVGVPETVKANMPHFNWKKGGLPAENFDATGWDLAAELDSAVSRGIRGDNSGYFQSAGCVLPTCLGDRYRGVTVLGPFAEAVDLMREKRFLVDVANTVGTFTLTELEVRYLEKERRRWRSTTRLLAHQFKTALTPITTQIGRAKSMAKHSNHTSSSNRIVGLLQRAEDLNLQLAANARKTLAGHAVVLEREDLEVERYPLSVLVANCLEGFILEAKKRNRELVVSDDVARLPHAEVDVARFTIALSNLIDNALKYSFPRSKIFVRAHCSSLANPDLAIAVIEIDDLGDRVPLEKLKDLFEEGTRGLTKAKLGRLPGTGLGLWEARAVVEAHGGEIGVTCRPTSIRRSQGDAYQVVFSITIPLKQKGLTRRRG